MIHEPDKIRAKYADGILHVTFLPCSMILLFWQLLVPGHWLISAYWFDRGYWYYRVSAKNLGSLSRTSFKTIV